MERQGHGSIGEIGYNDLKQPTRDMHVVQVQNNKGVGNPIESGELLPSSELLRTYSGLHIGQGQDEWQREKCFSAIKQFF